MADDQNNTLKLDVPKASPREMAEAAVDLINKEHRERFLPYLGKEIKALFNITLIGTITGRVYVDTDSLKLTRLKAKYLPSYH